MSAPHNTPAAAPLVFITGASSGIGQALALAYYRQGWRVALCARRLQTMQDWAKAQGLDTARVVFYEADVCQDASIRNAAERCMAQQDLPQMVIANAGISHGVDTGEAADIPVARQILETNVLGMAATFQPFIEPMRARRSGTLVGVASVAGVRGLIGQAAYCASKSAAITWCEALRGEMRDFGVRVITLCPGFVDTPLTQSNGYTMPFCLSAEAFAQRTVRALRSGNGRVTIPWQMGILGAILRVMPERLFDAALARVMRHQPRKPRKAQPSADAPPPDRS